MQRFEMDLGLSRRSMQWVLDNRVDAGAAAVYLTLPHNAQEDIRRAGMVYNAERPDRNPSAMLMSRINERVDGHVVKVPESRRCVARDLVNSQQLPSSDIPASSSDIR